MKKKMLLCIATIAAFMFSIPNVMAAAPTYDETINYGDGKVGTLFFANGTPITIEANADGGALIKWADGEKVVSEYSSIFGGSHDSTTNLATTSITMNGGTVTNIFGGGLHTSSVEKATILVNGGTVTGAITGGGAAAFKNTSCHRPWYSGEASTSTTRVDSVSITLNDGTAGIVYGGGEGISSTGTTTVEVNGGDYGYVIAGGSNGYTGKSTVSINDGTIGIVQSVNRGSMDEAEIDIYGGEIQNAYVGGDASDTTVDGTITNAYMYISGGEVANVAVGTNGGNDKPATTVATLDYNEESVTTVDTTGFDTDKVNTTSTLNLVITLEDYTDTITVEVPNGTELATFLDAVKAESNTELEGTGYEVGGFYTDKDYVNKVADDKVMDADLTLYIKLVEVEDEDTNTDTNVNTSTDTTTEGELPPKTADINLLLLISAILVSIVGIVIASKKTFAKNN